MDKVRFVGGWLSMDVVVKTAVEDGKDKDTDLKTVCKGKPGGPEHPPVKVNGLMRCSDPDCQREEKSYHPFPRGRDNGDGTWTIPSAEALAAAAIDKSLVETITVTRHAASEVEGHLLPQGRIYWLTPGKDARDKFGSVREAIRLDEAEGFVYMTLYARSTAPATYRVTVFGDLIALQEQADPNLLKERPPVVVDDANPVLVAQARTLLSSVHGPFDPANFADVRKKLTAEALAATEATEAGVDAPLATVTTLTPPSESPWAQALRAAGVDPANVAVDPITPARKRAPRKKAADTPPVQPLPSEVPDNVDTTLATPRKRTTRKVAAKTA